MFGSVGRRGAESDVGVKIEMKKRASRRDLIACPTSQSEDAADRSLAFSLLLVHSASFVNLSHFFSSFVSESRSNL